MFIVSLSYKVGLDEIDQELENHVAYLNEQYALGNFLASGRKVPRTGGVILAQMSNREALEMVLAQDPFQQKGLADYEIVEFVPSKVAPELNCLLEVGI